MNLKNLDKAYIPFIAIVKKHVRVVGVDIREDPFGDKILYIHPHIMDMFNNDTDQVLPALQQLGFKAAYSGEDNAFVVKV